MKSPVFKRHNLSPGRKQPGWEVYLGSLFKIPSNPASLWISTPSHHVLYRLDVRRCFAGCLLCVVAEAAVWSAVGWDVPAPQQTGWQQRYRWICEVARRGSCAEARVLCADPSCRPVCCKSFFSCFMFPLYISNDGKKYFVFYLKWLVYYIVYLHLISGKCHCAPKLN